MHQGVLFFTTLISCLLITIGDSAGNATLWLKSEYPHIIFGDDRDTWLYRMKSGAIASNDAIVAKRIVLLAGSAGEDEEDGAGKTEAHVHSNSHSKASNVTLQMPRG